MYEGREICRVFPDGGACIGYSNALFLQKIPCSTVMVISLDEVNEDTSGHPAALRNELSTWLSEGRRYFMPELYLRGEAVGCSGDHLSWRSWPKKSARACRSFIAGTDPLALFWALKLCSPAKDPGSLK